MRNPNFEKPQNSNPHGLTIKQHIFPVKSILRFANTDGKVCVYLKSENKQFYADSNNELFCAKRVWNQRAETGWMKDIEGQFQELADAILTDRILDIDVKEAEKISSFFVLWYLRATYRFNPPADAQLNCINGDPSLSKDQQEFLEKYHVGCIRPDATMSGRDIADGQMQIRYFSAMNQLKTVEWGILKALEGEIIVPDIFLKGSQMIYIIPLAPTCCLISLKNNTFLDLEGVRNINKLSINWSQEYYFARDFSKCPL
jgi:hypothetical protein